MPALHGCEQPWKDVATILLWTAMRPGEVFAMRWESIFLNEDGTGLLQIIRGKSNAARRVLPMVPVVFSAFKQRWESQGKPLKGWVFPSGSSCRHFEGSTAKGFHKRALLKANIDLEPGEPELKPFPPYTMRHTALTNLAADCDIFTLAKIAGHSSTTITQRYVHPQADAIERAFLKLGSTKSGHTDKVEVLKAPEESRVSAVVRIK